MGTFLVLKNLEISLSLLNYFQLMVTRLKVGSMKELMTASDLDDAACQEGINEDDEYMVRDDTLK